MGTKLIEVDYDFGAVAKILRALHNPVASDPGSPVNGEIWYNSGSGLFKFKRADGVQTIATLADVTGGAITGALWNAHSVVIAITDDTPIPLTLAASTVLGRRASGDIVAVSYANLLADLEGLGITALDLSGSTLAQVLARANHTGTQAASTISDFNSVADARAQTIVDAVIDAAPGTLNTLNELAAALGDDPNFATTLATSLGLKTEIYVSNFGNAAAQSFAFSHGFATTNVIVQVYRNSDNLLIDCGVVITDANTVTVTTITVPASNAYRVHIVGRNL